MSSYTDVVRLKDVAVRVAVPYFHLLSTGVTTENVSVPNFLFFLMGSSFEPWFVNQNDE